MQKLAADSKNVTVRQVQSSVCKLVEVSCCRWNWCHRVAITSATKSGNEINSSSTTPSIEECIAQTEATNGE